MELHEENSRSHLSSVRSYEVIKPQLFALDSGAFIKVMRIWRTCTYNNSSAWAADRRRWPGGVPYNELVEDQMLLKFRLPRGDAGEVGLGGGGPADWSLLAIQAVRATFFQVFLILVLSADILFSNIYVTWTARTRVRI
jgi:hypothetical protein